MTITVSGTGYGDRYSIKNTDSGQSAAASGAIHGTGESLIKFMHEGNEDQSSVTVTLKLYKGAPPQDTNPLQTCDITFG